jgi:hypothetical protein
MSSYLTDILSNILNKNLEYRTHGEESIKNLASIDYQKLLIDLANYIANNSLISPHRQLAATIFKNLINKMDDHKDKWLQIHPEIRKGIKETILNTLASPEKMVRKSVASLIASKII